MPFKRKPGRRSAAPKSAYKMAKKALSMVKREKPEVKCYDSTISAGGTGITAAGALYRFSAGWSQGVQGNERLGQNCHMTSLTYRGIIAAGSLSVPQQVRAITLIDKEMDGVLPVVGDVLGGYGISSDFYAPYNTDNRDRFHILEDKVYSLNPGQSASFHINKYFKLGRKVQFAKIGDGSTADSLAGQPFILLITDVGVNAPNFGMVSRINYYDS